MNFPARETKSYDLKRKGQLAAIVFYFSDGSVDGYYIEDKVLRLDFVWVSADQLPRGT